VATPVSELILAGNGPGELRGWVMPIARAARTAAGDGTALTMVLTPSQFATGREAQVVRGWGLFDRVVDVSEAVRIALGLRRLTHAGQSVVLHLGGDLWFSRRLARRLRVPACALAETTLIARRHRGFARIFAASPAVATALVEQGVPTEKIVPTGDPRADMIGRAAPPPAAETAPTLSVLPGSRDRLFAFIAPYFMTVADRLAAQMPAVKVQVIVSEFLSGDVLSTVQRRVAREWPRLAVTWVTGDAASALRSSDLAVTIPGTNTLELAYLAVPFAVVVDLEMLRLAPVEGAAEWLLRVPGLGASLKHVMLERRLRRTSFVALPNARAGRPLVPEWIGRFAPEDLAKRLAELLADRGRRMAIRTGLLATFGGPGGAARAIAESALRLAAAQAPA